MATTQTSDQNIKRQCIVPIGRLTQQDILFAELPQGVQVTQQHTNAYYQCLWIAGEQIKVQFAEYCLWAI